MGALLTLFRLMTGRRRRQFLVTLALMLLGAVAELGTIGAAFPFLALLSGEPGAGRFARWISWFPVRPDGVLGFAVILIAAAMIAAAVRLMLIWTTQRLVMGIGHDVATAIFSRMLRQPYAEFVRRNSSEVLGSLEKVRDIVGSMLQPAMQGLIAVVLSAAIATLLFIIAPFATIAAAGTVAAAYVVISMAGRGRLSRNSRILAEAATARTKIVQEGLGGIRDIMLDRSQPIFEAKFREIDGRFRRALASNVFISSAPRFLVESAGIVALALIAVAMSLEPGGLVRAIPVLGALALGAQRLLPLIQQAYNGWSLGLGNLQALEDVAILLASAPDEEEATETQPLPFLREIVFERVGFAYDDAAFTLRDVEVVVARGERVGIVGTTGSGKSTLLDLLMGLLCPTGGAIRIDGTELGPATRAAWQAQIAHVPQSIYLMDDSIAANIAFGVPPHLVDAARLAAAAEAARLGAFLAELPEGLATRVGERGIRLSGGQRQRIGLARALYKGAQVLILDEATSALDDRTEAEVMESLMGLGRTITLIMVAHRRSTLAGCDRILSVEGGRVTALAPEEAMRPRGAAG
jgi:ABC-type multidrug transport system fused ATPase/permease subunit